MTHPSSMTGVAIWRQIAESLAGDISSGGFKPGEKMPTEAALAERFQVNRHTLRRAIGDLSARGLVRVEQGRGMFVAEDVVEFVVGERTRFTALLASQRRTPGGRLLRALEIPADEIVAENLKIRRGTKIVMIERLGQADGRPISIGRHMFPAKRFPDLISYYEEENSITRALARCGVDDYVRLSTRVRARMATADELRNLQIPSSTPVLETRSINTDTGGRRIEFGISSFAASRVELLFEA
tara:strand:- start:288 stop:1013 length:726 start_codon:yes stop_codon:yes gene_type:complete